MPKEKGEKALESRAVNRQIDQVGKKIAERLFPLLKRKSHHLPENERAAVIAEFARTLAIAQLSSKLLVEYNLDPNELAKQLQLANPIATRLLSSDAEDLYERLLIEASREIISIATDLDSFLYNFSATVLFEQDRIYESLIKLLSLPDEQAARYEQDYCAAIKDRLDRIEIFGVPQVERIAKRQSLSVAYISLEAEQKETKKRGSDEKLPPRFHAVFSLSLLPWFYYLFYRLVCQ